MKTAKAFHKRRVRQPFPLFVLVFLIVSSNHLSSPVNATAAGSFVSTTNSADALVQSELSRDQGNPDVLLHAPRCGALSDENDDEVCIHKDSDDTESSIEASDPKDMFHIQGWRWHSLSLVRDLERLGKLASFLLEGEDREGSEHLPAEAQKPDAVSPNVDWSSLSTASKHVVEFNMAGLERVESELFFPWLRKHAKSMTVPTKNKESFTAFRVAIDDIDRDRKDVRTIAKEMRNQAELAASDATNKEDRIQATRVVAQLSSELAEKSRSIMDRKDRFVVPFVASNVAAAEQKSFNYKVLRKLGILDSRRHLVGMRDAVWACGDQKERDMFDEVIPKIPRMLIPRWRKSLYEPEAGVLDAF